MNDCDDSLTTPAVQPSWEVVAAHRDRLLSLARRRTLCHHDAEDVVAEALIRAMERPDLDADRLPAWLTTVTTNLCVDLYRRRERERRHWARASGPASVSFEADVCDRAESVWLATKLDELPARQATALRLRAEGFGVDQVARSLDVSYRTAESLLARGRATMRAILASALTALAWLTGRFVRGSGVATASAAGVATASAAGIASLVLLVPAAPHEQRTDAGVPDPGASPFVADTPNAQSGHQPTAPRHAPPRAGSSRRPTAPSTPDPASVTTPPTPPTPQPPVADVVPTAIATLPSELVPLDPETELAPLPKPKAPADLGPEISRADTDGRVPPLRESGEGPALGENRAGHSRSHLPHHQGVPE